MKLLATLFTLLLFPTLSGAAWWAENDYIYGSNGAKRDSVTAITGLGKTRLAAGVSAAFFKDAALYTDAKYTFRLPLMYTAPDYTLYFAPFTTPVAPDTGSGAYGAKAYYQTIVGADNPGEQLKVLIGAATATQKARLAGGGEKTFSQSVAEFQLEKVYFGEFFLMGSVAAFSKPSGVSNATLLTPALDHSELAYLGTFPHMTALPDWVGTAQLSRNMRPDFDSYTYLGYSKISLRQAKAASSMSFGIKLDITTKTTLDLAYNAVYQDGFRAKNYYRLLLRTLF